MRLSLFQGILLGVFGLGALIGLFVFATYSSNGGRDAVGSVVVWGTLPKDDMRAMFIAVAQTNSVLKDVSYEQKEPATLPSELASAIATGAAPDLVLASQEVLFALTKFITPIGFDTLPPRAFTSTFVQGTEIFTGPDGYYGIPFLVDPLVLFYNRSILSSNGIAKPPATWEAMTGLVPNVAILTPARQITRGLIALGTYGNVHDARGILSALFLQAGAPLSSYSASGAPIADLGSMASEGVPPGQAVLGFYTQFADPSKVSYTWNGSLSDSRQMFLVGDLALYLGYSSEARYLRSANPNLNFDVAPLPQPATAATKKAYGLMYAFMIPRGAKNAAGAYQAAAILSNSTEQVVAADAAGLTPAVLDVLATMPVDPAKAVSYAEALYTEGWLSPAPLDTDAVFSSMIGNVISGRSTPEAALVSAERSLGALLSQQ
ncbi:MAG: Extracellular solute-binding protein family 1 [Parcubacteria group bacterium GW2011_GWB1_57_6]|nr:MAG: Extracellular solute-binding protein family 1 [Parcubacteria group bacterium GW2011_GWA1_56_13]KKW46088.1 MAG: Extracellular solute-binding protein family 1 [Parcubacteria group bacterium GW2011_GWB1_57_6]